jgi:hypothetical protein
MINVNFSFQKLQRRKIYRIRNNNGNIIIIMTNLIQSGSISFRVLKLKLNQIDKFLISNQLIWFFQLIFFLFN